MILHSWVVQNSRRTTLGLQRGEMKWLGNVVLTQASAFPTHVVLYWKVGEKEPWYLATNFPTPHTALRLYRRRMWIEAIFGDLKKHGFDLEASHLRHFRRLSRLTLAVCLLYLWLVALAEHLLLTGQQSQVDRADRRNLRLFRLGWDFLERCLVRDDPIPKVALPNLCSLSGG
jgi:hypothetical protein